MNLEGIDAREVNSIKLFDDAEGRAVNVRVGKNRGHIWSGWWSAMTANRHRSGPTCTTR